jgi:hypothetical protein
VTKPRPSSGSFFAIPAVLALAIFPSSCFTHKPPAAFTPPPPQAAPVAAAPEHIPDPPLVTSVPDLDTSGTGIVPNGVPEAPAPPAPRTPPRRNPVATVKPPVTVTPDLPAQQPPRLGQILSAEQTRDFNRTFDECSERVRKVLTTLARKNLTPDQAEILNRIQVFQKQAEEKRDQDLVIAVSLARRADLLAKDLQDRVP